MTNMPPRPWMIYGAYGFTGRLIFEEASGAVTNRYLPGEMDAESEISPSAMAFNRMFSRWMTPRPCVTRPEVVTLWSTPPVRFPRQDRN